MTGVDTFIGFSGLEAILLKARKPGNCRGFIDGEFFQVIFSRIWLAKFTAG